MISRILLLVFSTLILVSSCRKTESDLIEPGLNELKRFPIDGPELLEENCERSDPFAFRTEARFRQDESYDGHGSFWTYFFGPALLGQMRCTILIGETGHLDVKDSRIVIRAKVYIEKSVPGGSASILIAMHYPDYAPDKYDVSFTLPAPDFVRKPRNEWFTEQIEATFGDKKPDNIRIYVIVQSNGGNGGIGIDDVRVFKAAIVDSI